MSRKATTTRASFTRRMSLAKRRCATARRDAMRELADSWSARADAVIAKAKATRELAAALIAAMQKHQPAA